MPVRRRIKKRKKRGLRKVLLVIIILFLAVTAARHFGYIPYPMQAAQKTTITAAQQAAHDRTLQRIQQQLQSQDGIYAVYFQPCKAGALPVIYNDHTMRSASMIKVFILSAAMEQIKQGKMSFDQTITLQEADKVGGAGSLCGYPDGSVVDVRTLLKLMITQSDNTATNLMIDLVGMDAINHYMQQHGYTETRLEWKMMAQTAPGETRKNRTSVRDLGTWFRRVYEKKCVDPALDQYMIDLLLGQTDTECFPTALPEAKIAHKTGEVTNLYDDGGIIFTSHGDYILCIMTDQIARYDGIETMKKIARMLVES